MNPKKTVNSLSEYIDYVEPLAANTNFEFYFRGQKSNQWGLTPSLFRYSPRRAYWDWEELERHMVREFAQLSLPHLQQIPDKWNSRDQDMKNDNFREWLAIMQHHGVPTRLLDWTTNPLVALYFACQSITTKNGEEIDGRVWITQQEKPYEYIFPLSGPKYFYPRTVSRNIEAQQALLAIYELPQNLEEFQPQYDTNDHCINVPYTKKARFLRTLQIMGVHDFSLFPSLNGLSGLIKSEYLTKKYP